MPDAAIRGNKAASINSFDRRGNPEVEGNRGTQKNGGNMSGMSFFLFDTAGYPPRWLCGSGWQDEPVWGWLHIGCDVAVWGAYTAIPILLYYFLRRRPDIPFPRIIWLFIGFIFACGSTHLIEACLFWWPVYKFSAVLKLTTAVVSWATVVALFPVIPAVLALRTPAQLELVVQQRTEELQELTARLRAEVDLRSSVAKTLEEKETRLRLALLAGRMGTWDWDLTTGEVAMDRVEQELAGLKPRNGVVRIEEFMERVHPDDRSGLHQAIARATEHGEDYAHEFRVQTADGNYRWLAGRGVASADSSGRAVRMRGVNFDISELKQTQVRLAESEGFLRSLLESSADGIKVLDAECRILSANAIALQDLEIDHVTDILGRDWRTLWPPECAARVQAALTTALQGGVGRFQGARQTAKGHEGVWDVVVTAVRSEGQPTGRLLCISRDVTEIRHAVQAMRESEDRFLTLANHMAQFAWMADDRGDIFWFNRRWFEFTGTTPEQMRGQGWKQVLHPDHAGRVVDKLTRCLEQGEVWEDTFPLRAKDGRYRWFLSRAVPIRDEQGSVTRWFGTNTDVTELLSARQALARAHAQLKAVVETAAEAIVTFDDQGRIQSSNSAVEQIFGIPPSDVVGRALSQLIPHCADLLVRDVGKAPGESGRGTLCKDREVAGRRGDGRLVPLEVSISETVVGNQTIYTGIMRDITARKQTESVLRVRTRVMDFATNGIFVTDALAGRAPIVYVNPAFEELTGYAAEEVLGKDCSILQGPDTDPVDVQALKTALARREECHVISLNYRKDGSRFWNDLHLSPVVDDTGEVTHFVGVMSDVTGRIRYERRLREAHELAAAANRAKSEFLANMSHEIRTPLTALLGCADSLYRQLDQDEPRSLARMIRNQGQLLLGILNDVLDLSKIEAGKLEIRLEPCEITRVIGDVHSLMHAQAAERGIELRTSYLSRIPRHVQTDPLRLKQILLNLTSNAIKFTEEGTVEIQVSLRIRDQGAMLQIAVIDTGIGIPSDRLDAIFEAFSQEKNPLSGKVGGTGLGLTICQKLVQMLGGHISVTSTLGAGSRFIVELPVDHVDQSALLNPDEISPELVKRDSTSVVDIMLPSRVLIVEDTSGIQFMMRRMLKDVVQSVTIAANGVDAIEAVQRAEKDGRPFDIILMDMQMPVMNGFDATAILRQRGYRMPVIALTAGAMAGDRDKCLAAGCDDYLPKPIDRNELLAKLHKYCGV